jgi:hypothetical protein
VLLLARATEGNFQEKADIVLLARGDPNRFIWEGDGINGKDSPNIFPIGSKGVGNNWKI